MSQQNDQLKRNRLDLSRLLAPSAIAIVGASTNPQSIGGQPLRYMQQFGYKGGLYPVNPGKADIQGVPCFNSVLDILAPCDVAVVAVAARRVPQVIRDCGTAHIPYAVVLSAGFDEVGGAGSDLQKELQTAITQSGVRLLGPNCTGIVNLHHHVYCAQGGALSDPTLKAGPIAIVSQSGGVGLGILAFAQGAGLGTHCLVSSGNEVDLNVFDFVEHLLEDDDVSVIVLYLESSTEGKRIRTLGKRALEVGKPIVVLKAGNSGAARTAATSHTGRLTADYELFKTAFREGGYVEADDIDDLIELAKALRVRKRATGKRCAILTGSGGWGVMMSERCEQLGMSLSTFAPDTLSEISKLTPDFGSITNPVDVTPQGYGADHAIYGAMCRHLLADANVDILLTRSATGGNVQAWAERTVEAAESTDKPVLVNWAPSPLRYLDEKKYLEDRGIACIAYPGRLARVAAAITEFSLKTAAVKSADSAVTSSQPIPLPLRADAGTMGEYASKKCLQAYGISVTRDVFFKPDQIDSVDLSELRFPVAVKAESADLPHKTEAGGVLLNVADAAGVRAAAHTILKNVRAYAPQAVIDGITVQEMAAGVEVILGAVVDPHFGPYIMFGMGGIFAEIARDVSYRYAPVNKEQALAMMQEVKGAKLLAGARGQSARDADALADTIVRLSQLIIDHQTRVSEIEINPLFVRERGAGVTAADCLITVR